MSRSSDDLRDPRDLARQWSTSARDVEREPARRERPMSSVELRERLARQFGWAFVKQLGGE